MIYSKKIPSLAISLLICILVCSQSNIDILHYRFNLTLDDKYDTIYGSATIIVRFLQPDTLFSIDLVTQNKQGKGMKTDKIVSDKGIKIKNFVAKNDKVNIVLSRATQANDTAIFTIYYHGIPADGLIISNNRYGDRTFFADNWPNRAHNWIPCVDDLADKASFEFIVTAPTHYLVISNGLQIEETKLSANKKLTHWSEDIPLPTKVMVIGAADFAVKKYYDSPYGIPVTAWVFAKDSTDGFIDYDQASSILKYFIYYIGPYPYNKLANVQSKTIFGGMENASAIFYSENSVNGNHNDESLIAHEIAHQWFGDMVTEKSFAHLWLSEGFATYLAHLYIEARYGTDSLDIEMQKDRKAIINYTKRSDKPVIDSVSAYNQLLNSNNYEKGSWVLHMLRRQLGDSVFQQIIRSYYDVYKGKNADTKDFQAIAEKISGENLDSFFRQWLYASG
ncbi:MAG: M1 family metallopeptidase, partial [Bacteroidia bacterium]|nr:M1 family metallopeptidase [Bacteroidia bacterium]